MSGFVHLHVHSEYSLADGLVRLQPLAEISAQHAQPAVALTDLANVHGMVKFYRACMACGVKPLIGCDVWVENPLQAQRADRSIVLCRDHRGYRNLSRFLTGAHLRARKGRVVVAWREFEQFHDGLLVLFDDQEGPLAITNRPPRANGGGNGNGDANDAQLIDAYRRVVGDALYFQVSRVGYPGEAEYIARAAALASAHGVGLAATNRVEFIDAGEFHAHEIRVCINSSRKLREKHRPRRFTPHQYLKSADAMRALFADLPEALDNTLEIAKRCNLFLNFGENFLPPYTENGAGDGGDGETVDGDGAGDGETVAGDGAGDGETVDGDSAGDGAGAGETVDGDSAGAGETVATQTGNGAEQNGATVTTVTAAEPVDQILRRRAAAGLRARLGGEPNADYTARLDLELGVIAEMGYAGYFLIVADFIRWAKANDIPVGPGRGSGAGSLVAWATGITEPDPLHYGLLFERFLHPERVSLPDFDIDFCVYGRDRVIEYVAARYGHAQVAQITTFNTLKAKAAVRDVGRVMDLPLGLVDKVARLIPAEINITLARALKEEAQLGQRYREEDDIKQLIDNAMRLEGIARNAGKHAAGVVIAPSRLTEYTPLYSDAQQDQAVTHLDKDDLEAIGLVKFDFLGLDALTTIHMAVQTVNRARAAAGEALLDLAQVPLDDAPTYRLIQRAATTAIFQLESRGIRELIAKLKPDQFDDLVALVALYRPGPLQSGMVDDFIERKHGRARMVFPHPDTAPILESTYGIIVYQEQVMQIAQVLAGYTLGSSDILRQAMGKKKPEEMRKQRAIFRDGATARGVQAKVADEIFSQMETFAGYGFNKSHAVAYALVAYHTAWLKAHYPAAYMAAALSSAGNTDRVMALLADCEQLGLDVKPPRINDSSHDFRPLDERAILYGLGAVRGIGKTANAHIESERASGGAFADMFDLCRRLDLRIANRRVLEALVKSGALDAFGERAALLADIGGAVQGAEQASRDAGQSDMFGAAEKPPASPVAQRVAAWSEQQRLDAEKEALGLYLSGHPYNRYRDELAGVTQLVSELDLTTPRPGAFAGLMTSRRDRRTRRGKMAFLTLDNGAERIEVTLYAEALKRCGGALRKGRVLVAQGEFGIDDYNGAPQMRAARVTDIDAFRAERVAAIRLRVTDAQLANGGIERVRQLLSPHRGGNAQITLRYQSSAGPQGEVKLGDAWTVHPTAALMDSLREWLGPKRIEVQYDKRRTPEGK
ncbi:MAG: DNA polymerase III subunit alpha [Gammaproteobacteria bacterium]|nr:DNA polymerase III subunit alpha [Gammaproteobacteria bacterium]